MLIFDPVVCVELSRTKFVSLRISYVYAIASNMLPVAIAS
jgi:hypothetical protein